MQSFAVLDQQDDECGNTIKTKTLWKLSTCQGPSTLFPVVTKILIFLQRIWMVLQLLHTPQNSRRRQKIVVIVVCCLLLSARLEFEEDVSLFDDQDHMDFIGEFTFRVNETCLSSDHNIFIVAPAGRDAHNPLLVHLHPSDMIWREKRAYVPYEMKQRRKEKRKATQKSNKRKGHGDGPSVDESGSNWYDTGYGGSSASSSWTWRPKNR